MTTFNIKNSVVFITGTNKKDGLGRAFINELLQQGVKKIYATARSVEQLKDLKEGSQGKVVPVALDVTDDAAVKKLGSLYPDVTLLINNAGVFTGAGALENADMAVLEMAVNYIAPLRITQSFAPVFKSTYPKKTTALVNINSIASLVSFPIGGTYSASKSASHSLTQSQRRELSDTLVIGVYPGPIDTQMTKSLPLEKAAAQVVAQALSSALKTSLEDVFPDATAQQLFAGWKADAKALEAQMAAPSPQAAQ